MSPIVGSLANGSTRGYGGLRSFAPDTAFESIATATGTGSSNTITFNSIPGTYQHLQIRYIGKTAYNQISSSAILFRINGDTGTNYSTHRLIGGGSSAASQGYSSQTSFFGLGITNGSTTIVNMMGVGIIDIHDYASTTKNKTMRSIFGFDCNTNNVQEITLGSGVWLNTSAITSLTLVANDGNWSTNTQIALYGIKGA